MADDERRDEIEAGIAAIIGRYARTGESRAAREVLAYLDRVRDARGGDGPTCNCDNLFGTRGAHADDCPLARSSQGEGHEAGIEAAYDAADACFPSSAQGRWLRPAVEAAVAAYLSRVSPQAEAHEAGIEAAAKFIGFTKQPTAANRSVAERAVAAYLARVSPSRDGTVAVEDVEKRALKVAERLRDDPQQERWVIAAYEEGAATIEGEPTPVCRVQGPSTSSQGVEVVPLGDLAWAIASAEFSPASTGDREAER